MIKLSATSREVLFQLLKAKRHSDRGEYTHKRQILEKLLKENPEQFRIDSRQTHTVGITHNPTSFRIHTPKGAVPHSMLYKLKTAFMTL